MLYSLRWGFAVDNFSKNKKAGKRKIAKHTAKYRKLWENFRKVAKAVNAVGGKIAIEWPSGCSYWKESSVIRFLELLGLSKRGVRVDGCMVGLSDPCTNKLVYKP